MCILVLDRAFWACYYEYNQPNTHNVKFHHSAKKESITTSV